MESRFRSGSRLKWALRIPQDYTDSMHFAEWKYKENRQETAVAATFPANYHAFKLETHDWMVNVRLC